MSDYLESDIHIWRRSSVVEEVVHALVGGLGWLGHVGRVGRHKHLLLLVVQEPLPGLLLVQHHTGTLWPGNYLVFGKLCNKTHSKEYSKVPNSTGEGWLKVQAIQEITWGTFCLPHIDCQKIINLLMFNISR